MTSAPNSVADLLDILAELSNQLASELDLHYDDLSDRAFEEQIKVLERSHAAIAAACEPVPEALAHILNKARGQKNAPIQ